MRKEGGEGLVVGGDLREGRHFVVGDGDGEIRRGYVLIIWSGYSTLQALSSLGSVLWRSIEIVQKEKERKQIQGNFEVCI